MPGFNAYIVDDRQADFNYNITPCFASAPGRTSGLVFIIVNSLVVLLTMMMMI